MLRLHGAGLFHERILTFKGEDGLSSHALRLLPCSISGVVMIVEVNYVLKVGSVSFVGQTILLSHGLGAIDHLDWEAGGGRRVWLFYDNPVTGESFRSRFSYWRRQMHQKLRSSHQFRRPHHPRIVANVNCKSAHLLLRFLAPGVFCCSSVTVNKVVRHQPEQQQLYLPLMLVCPFSALLFGSLTSEFTR